MTAPIEHQLYEEIRREHEHLRELLGGLHQTLSGRAEAAGTASEMMSSLQQHVQEHFNEEEEGGFFHEVVCQAPRLSDRTESLKSEHVALAATVAELVEAAENERDLCTALERRFHDFSKSLMQHEGKENDLLLDAYELDIGRAD